MHCTPCFIYLVETVVLSNFNEIVKDVINNQKKQNRKNREQH